MAACCLGQGVEGVETDSGRTTRRTSYSAVAAAWVRATMCVCVFARVRFNYVFDFRFGSTPSRRSRRARTLQLFHTVGVCVYSQQHVSITRIHTVSVFPTGVFVFASPTKASPAEK